MRAAAVAGLLAVALAAAATDAADEADYVRVPAGSIRSMLAYADDPGPRSVAAFEVMAEPVTNQQFLAFVRTHPQWQRDRVPALYADAGQYLSHWRGPLDLGTAGPRQPVTRVSWFAAQAYCAAEQARLPDWDEWEYLAAADATRRDARSDPDWSARILEWYAHSAAGPLPDVGGAANAYGVRDLHGLVWEWTEDYSALLVSGDSRSQGDPERLKFCGAGALAAADRGNYPVMMRVALLSSLRARDTTSSLGFRCARSLP